MARIVTIDVRVFARLVWAVFRVGPSSDGACAAPAADGPSAPLSAPSHHRPQRLEHGFVLLEAGGDLVVGDPGVGIKTLGARISALRAWPRPSTVSEIRASTSAYRARSRDSPSTPSRACAADDGSVGRSSGPATFADGPSGGSPSGCARVCRERRPARARRPAPVPAPLDGRDSASGSSSKAGSIQQAALDGGWFGHRRKRRAIGAGHAEVPWRRRREAPAARGLGRRSCWPASVLGSGGASCPFRIRVQSNSTSGLCCSIRRMASSSSADASDAHAGRRPEPVEDPGAGLPAARGRCGRRPCFVAALVAAEPAGTAGCFLYFLFWARAAVLRAGGLLLVERAALLRAAGFGRLGAARGRLRAFRRLGGGAGAWRRGSARARRAARSRRRELRRRRGGFGAARRVSRGRGAPA